MPGNGRQFRSVASVQVVEVCSGQLIPDSILSFSSAISGGIPSLNAKDLPPDKRQFIRNEKARPIADALHQWMLAHRQKVPDGSGTARALDYSLKRWKALTGYLDDGAVPIDNNWVENQIRPWALGRSNWLFAGSLRNGQRAAAVMTLIQSAKLNGHDPYAYLKDVLARPDRIVDAEQTPERGIFKPD
jgi:hypothetical protein